MGNIHLTLSDFLNEQKIVNENKSKLNFKKWFGDSKVVDKNGDPLIVYHGTIEDKFTTFKISKSGLNHSYSRGGFCFTDNIKLATGYGTIYSNDDEDVLKNLIPVYLSIQNPVMDYAEDLYSAIDKFDLSSDNYMRSKLSGNDGVIINSSNGSLYVVFYPNQIKSVDNEGTWDKNNNNMYK